MTLAEEFGAEIVSCDSMQVYRGFDIGTAKPSEDERRRVPHHLVDCVDPDDPFSAAAWAGRAEAALREIAGRGNAALVVGGTGLYLRALRFGLVDAPPRDEALRRQLADEEATQPGLLHARLSATDPASAARIQPRDLVRIIRALEVYTLTGQMLSAHYAAQEKTVRRELPVVVLDPPGEWLDLRIAARATQMIDAGLVEEAGRLRALYPGSRLLQAVGYRQAGECIDGVLAQNELAPAITRATRQYARRQRTWFRAEKGAQPFAESAAALERLRALLTI